MVLCRILIVSSRYRDSCHRHTPNRHVQCCGFSCSRGRCSRPALSTRSHHQQHSRRRHNRNIRPLLVSAVDFWNWSELELGHSRAAEFHSKLVVMMTTRMNCRLNYLICHLSLFVDWWKGGCQVSGVSCVSHDGVRLEPSPRAHIVSRAKMEFLIVSSVPAFGLFSRTLRHSLSQPCALGLSVTCLTRSLSPTQCLLYGVSHPMTIFAMM